ncbi:AFR495Cp [Eremothecium gossypii ATCC 10895]|uniref:AFR495Cp n=1 Tax=Eremothecium gossypii (strain ATCC 10895 / CBS 109.51 / FGSC 9923 / NRRL Y-1056) TaxID=284811 RepID=Q752S8_EREGS|nr:AFR495Cp [Eremothecium gossypii ATCC 10895]AAS53866.1 AFR495Cp [Eremothecium gossypii ATCC 10895]
MSVPVSQRTSRTSSTSSTGAKPMSTVESSVTKLLISTKTLLQRLTQWSRKSASESQVSDAYVQLGNDFKLVSKHFAHAGIEVTDLGDVPMELRRVLEVALREPATEETLNKYLPHIREIIVSLLDKLKAKQSQLKQKKSERRGSALSNAGGKKGVRAVEEAPVRVEGAGAVPERASTVSASPAAPANGHEDALVQLKKGVTLQRRASKRFSAYHMAKLTHMSSSELPTPTLPSSADYTAQGPPLSRGSTKQGDGNTTEAGEQDSVRREVLNRQSRLAADGASITLFLKLNNKVKKATVTMPLTFNQLRLLFVEKFTYLPGGGVFPDIYIKEPEYDVAYELEESQLHYIKDGTLLLLSLEPAPSHAPDMAEKFETLRNELLESQREMLSQVKSLLANERAFTTEPLAKPDNVILPKSKISAEIHSIKHELSVLNQAHNTGKQALTKTIKEILEKVKKFQSLSFNASTSANRVYMEQSHSKLSELSDSLLAKVDDLQDIIEALRKDVAIRGAKPTKKKLEAVQQELKQAMKDLKKIEQYINIEKPNWKMIWESELDKVCEEQQFLTLQEDLVFDLQEDLTKANETFDLVKLCCEEQEKNPKRTRTNPILPLTKPGTLTDLRDMVLMEVQNLNPDHESRVQAIERAEKLREKELQYKDSSVFESELVNFVGNNGFKRAGGIEEVERIRRARDEENLRSNFGLGAS